MVEGRSCLLIVLDLVSRCIVANYSTSQDAAAKKKCYQELLDFPGTLTPRFANTRGRITLQDGFWPALIQLYYLYVQISHFVILSKTPSNRTCQWLPNSLSSPAFRCTWQRAVVRIIQQYFSPIGGHAWVGRAIPCTCSDISFHLCFDSHTHHSNPQKNPTSYSSLRESSPVSNVHPREIREILAPCHLDTPFFGMCSKGLLVRYLYRHIGQWRKLQSIDKTSRCCEWSVRSRSRLHFRYSCNVQWKYSVRKCDRILGALPQRFLLVSHDADVCIEPTGGRCWVRPRTFHFESRCPRAVSKHGNGIATMSWKYRRECTVFQIYG